MGFGFQVVQLLLAVAVGINQEKEVRGAIQ